MLGWVLGGLEERKGRYWDIGIGYWNRMRNRPGIRLGFSFRGSHTAGLFDSVEDDIPHFFQDLRLQEVVDELISRSGLVQSGMGFHVFGFTSQPTAVIVGQIILHSGRGGLAVDRGVKNAVGPSLQRDLLHVIVGGVRVEKSWEKGLDRDIFESDHLSHQIVRDLM
jgi:hypothetical protein